jgi:uncharacterized membrane protein YkvA (DUF1232 family)
MSEKGPSIWTYIWAILGVILSLLYLSNPGWGIFELLPDALPGIGNIDEVIATTILLTSLAKLGIQIAPTATKLPRAELIPEKKPQSDQ